MKVTSLFNGMAEQRAYEHDVGVHGSETVCSWGLANGTVMKGGGSATELREPKTWKC